MLTEYFDSYAENHAPYKNGAWCYEDGLVYRGLELLYRDTDDPRWLAHVQRMVDAQIDEQGKLQGYNPSDYNIDNILSGRALLFLDEMTDDARYLNAAGQLIDQLATHPRTQSGVYWHKLRYPWQVWLDGLYMGLPFQIGCGVRTGQDALVDDALQQLFVALKMTFAPATGLFAHATDEARKQEWANDDTGQTSAHWARALGWLAMALVDIADLVGPDRFERFRAQTERYFARLGELVQPDGLWLQVIDAPDLAGNYTESSASAMFAYAFSKAKTLGLKAPDGQAAFSAVCHCLSASGAGALQLQKVCHVAGLGYYEGRYRDGTASYYVSEALRPDDPKGVGPLMMAAASLGLTQAEELAALSRAAE